MIKFIVLIIIVIILAIIIHRKFKLYHDHIYNANSDPFLLFAEQERRKGKQLFYPWTTTNTHLLSLAKKYFPDIAIPQINNLIKPDITPVKIELMDKAHHHIIDDESEYFIAVGGPPAAMVAFQQAKNGKRVLYVNNSNINSLSTIRPIWAGAANHGEPDVLTMAPSYISGHHPFKFLWRECKNFINPSRYSKEVLFDNYPWLTLNIEDWIKHPLQIPAGIRVAWGNYQLLNSHEKAMNQGINPDIYKELRERANNSGKYLEAFNIYEGKILRESRGSLIVAPDQMTWSMLQEIEKQNAEDSLLCPITLEEANLKYGIIPRNAFGMMEKKHDFIFKPDFLSTIFDVIKFHGGSVITNWHLTRILVDPQNIDKGLFEFRETINDSGHKYHYRKFTSAHLSLGSTLFDPNPYDLISVTGVSINALAIGAKLPGGPIICGGKGNHIAVVPFAEPIMVNDRYVSFIRIAAGGCVGPLNRSYRRWYTYPGQAAINALHCLRKTFPENVDLNVLSVIGCNRLIGKDGHQVEINPFVRKGNKKFRINSITIQIGAGGGGLTQMGAVPSHSNISDYFLDRESI